MRILLATGIYPPAIGGPAQYAQNLEAEWRRRGHTVRVLTFGLEHYLPTGLRHLWFFGRALFALGSADVVIALDTFSVAVPTYLAARLRRTKMIIRTGGDFLWESYVERSGNLVLFREFYQLSREQWTRKEHLIFSLSRWVLCGVEAIVFSTAWQRDIFVRAYGLDPVCCHLIENYFGPREVSSAPSDKVFVTGGRLVKLKQWPLLQRIFDKLHFSLEILSLPHAQFLARLRQSYAVILISLSDLSPNLAIDALRLGKPVILTQETGLRERLGDAVIWVDPLDEEDIKAKITWLADRDNYRAASERAQQFHFTHDWSQVADEFIALANKL